MEKRKQETIAKIRQLAGKGGVFVSIGGAKGDGLQGQSRKQRLQKRLTKLAIAWRRGVGNRSGKGWH